MAAVDCSTAAVLNVEEKEDYFMPLCGCFVYRNNVTVPLRSPVLSMPLKMLLYSTM